MPNYSTYHHAATQRGKHPLQDPYLIINQNHLVGILPPRQQLTPTVRHTPLCHLTGLTLRQRSLPDARTGLLGSVLARSVFSSSLPKQGSSFSAGAGRMQ